MVVAYLGNISLTDAERVRKGSNIQRIRGSILGIKYGLLDMKKKSYKIRRFVLTNRGVRDILKAL